MEKMSKVVSNKRQLRHLVQLLRTNYNIARGLCSKTASQKKWEEFALELNSMGPPQREWHKWQRVWADLKCKIKKKKNENDFEMRRTGGNPTRLYHFSDTEEAVIEMLEIDNESKSGRQEFEEEMNYDDSVMSANESLISVEDIKFDPANYSQLVVRNDLLTKKPEDAPQNTSISSNFMRKSMQSSHTQTQSFEPKTVCDGRNSPPRQFYENMSELMRDIKRSINNIEDHIKRQVQQKDEILDLKRQKLKLYKEKMKSERVDRKAKLKLKAQLLALKKLKLNSTNNH